MFPNEFHKSRWKKAYTEIKTAVPT